jgi:hypothetical protein
LSVSLVGLLSTDVVGGTQLHVIPESEPSASLRLPPAWRCELAEIRDSDESVVARLGDRVEVIGDWIEGLVSLRGPSRVLRVDSIRLASR